MQSQLLSTNCVICYYTHPVDKITSQRVIFFAESYEYIIKQNYLIKLDIAVTVYCYLQRHVFRCVRVRLTLKTSCALTGCELDKAEKTLLFLEN